MGGKGGGDASSFYTAPPDTSGYATPEQAQATLAAQAPLDLSGMQQAIDVNKAANAATAPTPTNTMPTDTTTTTPSDTGTAASSAVLAPPNYWFDQTLQPQPAAPPKDKSVTTQS